MNHLNIVNFACLQNFIMMKKCISLFVLLILLREPSIMAQGPDVVIPVPAEVSVNIGTYRFRKNPKIRFVNTGFRYTGERVFPYLFQMRQAVTMLSGP